jgi:thiamine-monophosphate kinase
LKLEEIGEFGLIDLLRRRHLSGGTGVRLGAGDDVALLREEGGGLLAFTADMLVEGIHFDLSFTDTFSLGYKSLAVNLSDLAAVGGGGPCWAVVSLGLPPGFEVEAVEGLYRGMAEIGGEHDCAVVGGDTVRSPRGLLVNVALLGRVREEDLLPRGGAAAGEILMVTGALGASALGLAALLRGRGGEPEFSHLVDIHLRPRPRLDISSTLRSRGATAAIDLSDGLLRDLGHICEESGLGAVVEYHRIPLPAEAENAAAALQADLPSLVLGGGEDYELLLAVRPERAGELEGSGTAKAIGRLVEGSGVTVLGPDGRGMDTASPGWDHFRGKP